MNEEQRNAITSVVWEERINQRKDNRVEDLKILYLLKKQPQINVYLPSKDEMQKFVAAGKQVYNEMKDKYPAEVLKVVEDQRVK